MDEATTRWVLLAVVNTPVYLGLGALLFGDWGSFFDCLRFWFTPDWISLLRGEWGEDRWAELKLFVFGALCVGVVYGEHQFFFAPKPQVKISRLQRVPTCAGCPST